MPGSSAALNNVAVASAALSTILLLAPSTAAQIPPVPCELDRSIGGGDLVGLATRNPGVMDLPNRDYDVGVLFTASWFDFEGLPPGDSLRARLTSLLLTFEVGDEAGEADPDFVRVSIPYVDYEGRIAGERVAAAGWGDVQAAIAIPFCERRLALDLAGSLPTGSETRGLGHGEVTLSGGVTWRLGPRGASGLLPMNTAGAPLDPGDPPFELSLAYQRFLETPEMSNLALRLGFTAVLGRVLLDLTAAYSAEVHGAVPLRGGGSRPAEDDLAVGAAVRIGFGSNRQWRILVGAESDLDAEGLHDDLTAIVGVERVF